MRVETKVGIINNKKRICLCFQYNPTIIKLIKQIDGRKWSASNKLWHIPYQENYLRRLNKQFRGKLEFIEEMKATEEYTRTLMELDYSEPTTRSYCSHFKLFMRYFAGIEPDNITPDQIREYVIYLVEVKKLILIKKFRFIHYATASRPICWSRERI